VVPDLLSRLRGNLSRWMDCSCFSRLLIQLDTVCVCVCARVAARSSRYPCAAADARMLTHGTRATAESRDSAVLQVRVTPKTGPSGGPAPDGDRSCGPRQLWAWPGAGSAGWVGKRSDLGWSREGGGEEICKSRPRVAKLVRTTFRAGLMLCAQHFERV